jgi:hypothetical protein
VGQQNPKEFDHNFLLDELEREARDGIVQVIGGSDLKTENKASACELVSIISKERNLNGKSAKSIMEKMNPKSPKMENFVNQFKKRCTLIDFLKEHYLNIRKVENIDKLMEIISISYLPDEEVESIIEKARKDIKLYPNVEEIG